MKSEADTNDKSMDQLKPKSSTGNDSSDRKDLFHENTTKEETLDNKSKRKRSNSCSSIINFDMNDDSSSSSGMNPSDMLLDANNLFTPNSCKNDIMINTKNDGHDVVADHPPEKEQDNISLFHDTNTIKIGIGSSILSWKQQQRKRQQQSHSNPNNVTTIGLDSNDITNNLTSEPSLLQITNNDRVSKKHNDYTVKVISNYNNISSTANDCDNKKYNNVVHTGYVKFLPTTNHDTTNGDDQIVDCIAIYDKSLNKYVLEIVGMITTDFS